MKFFLSILFLFFFGLVAAQSILVGTHSTNDVFQDIPDTTISAVPYNNEIIKFELDINNDSTIDFTFFSIYISTSGASNKHLKIQAGDNIQLLYGTSACNYNFCKPANYGDTLNNSCSWMGNGAYGFLTYNFYYEMGGCSYGNGANYEYIGCRMFYEQDTLYGWIGLSVSNNNIELTIKEFAYNKPNYETVPLQNNTVTKCYPNPNHGFLQIILPNSIENPIIKFTDIYGETICIDDFSLNSDCKEISIITSNLPKGLYVLNIQGSNQIYKEKIIIQ